MIGRVIALAVVTISTAASAQTAPKQPTGKWVVDFDDEQCLASRNYGTKESPLFLAIKEPPLGEVIQLSIVQRGSALTPRQEEATLSFDNGDVTKISMVVFSPRNSGTRVYQVNVPPTQAAPLHQAREIAIRAHGLNEHLALSSMEALLKTMRTCVSELREIWNVRDGDGPHPRIKEGARASLEKIFKPSDYPGVALEENSMGTVSLALLIDNKGNVADCTIVGTSETAALDAQSCVIIKARAKFKPAIGWDGKPIRSSYLQRITWRTELSLPRATRIKR